MKSLIFLLYLSLFGWGFVDQDIKKFKIALYPNSEGVNWIRNYVLDHVSNPDSPLYGEYLTSDQINNMVKPSGFKIRQVTEWLSVHNIKYKIFGDTIHCVGRISDIDMAFKTKMVMIGNKWGSTIDYEIPSHLLNTIQFIDELVFRPYHYQIFKNRKVNNNSDKNDVSKGYVTREVMERLYNMSGDGLSYYISTSVGAMEYQGDSGFSQKDLLAAQVASNVPAHRVAKDHIIGHKESPDGESQLDMAVIWWGNGNATLWYEDYNGWMFGWATDFFNRRHYPEVVSLSWGWNERDQCSIVDCTNITNEQYVDRTNNEFMKIAAKGVSIVVASGDAGSPGRTNEGCVDNPGSPINPVFPGSSEWVTSVGATYIVKTSSTHKWKTPICHQVNCANGTEEKMTTYDKTEWTSGAGWGWWTNTPKWQQKQVLSYLNSNIYFPKIYDNNKTLRWNPFGRGYPDVSSFGHSCTIHGDYGWFTEDGTSCSAPVFAGIIAYLNDHQKSRHKPIIGFANPILYKMFDSNPLTFNDITYGNSSCTEMGCCGEDYGFTAIKGWDVVSGLGTPNIGRIIEWLNNYT